MQAIILAAGYGSRLRPLTETLPKSLTEVNGVPLLINELNLLAQNGIDEVIIVTGHMHDKIISTIGYEFNGMRVIYVYNSVYKETNNVYSLYLAKDYVKDDVILLECDLFFGTSLIKKILKSDAECNILVSKYNPQTMDGTVVKTDENGIVESLIIKKRQGEKFSFIGALKTVNIYKFSYNFMKDFFLPELDLYVNTQNKNSYYELVLGALIYYGNIKAKAVLVEENEWAEIDDIEDLERAEQKFRGL